MPVSIVVMCAIAIVGVGLAALGVQARIRFRDYTRTRGRSRPGQEFSLERYQPMVRLLADADAEFLSRSTTCPKTADRWERSRRRIIRLYLKELAADFRQLHAKARVLVAESPESYAALVPLLFRQQVAFWRILTIIELRLALGGWNVPQTRVKHLIGVIEAMQHEISRVAAASPAQA
jgi:hypothetical protein